MLLWRPCPEETANCSSRVEESSSPGQSLPMAPSMSVSLAFDNFSQGKETNAAHPAARTMERRARREKDVREHCNEAMMPD